MKFGPVPLAQAEGAVLAHSVKLKDQRLRKGVVLEPAHLAALAAGGVASVVVARPEADDCPENRAAEILARALVGHAANLTTTEPFTGRVNVIAAAPGLLRIDAASIAAFNGVDPGITVATLANFARVEPGTMIATIKIIPYAVPRTAVEQARDALASGVIGIETVKLRHADLILTRAANLTDKALKKGGESIRTRLAALGVTRCDIVEVPHEQAAVRDAVASSTAPLVLILGASATSDAEDVCPAAVVEAGGRLIRFGMPVDPGNLLFLAEQGGRKVIGLPGCARSPALNGADWVLERLVCGLEVTDADIAGMGVGGLLKEIPQRPRPRGVVRQGSDAFEVVLLAAGASRRMRGRDKLTEPIGHIPLLRRMAEVALASRASAVRVVLPPDAPERRQALAGLDVAITVAENASTGMAASLRQGVRQVADTADGVIVMLADMPDVSAEALNLLMSAFDPSRSHEICRALSSSGVPGHPVLFGRRFFEALSTLEGDVGARSVLTAAPDFVHDVITGGDAALTDLDTPEQWDAYRATR